MISVTGPRRIRDSQLNARFVHGLDSAANDGCMFANVFTADGTNVDADGAIYEGRERLAALRQDPEGRKGPTDVRHYIANELVETAPGGARAPTC